MLGRKEPTRSLTQYCRDGHVKMDEWPRKTRVLSTIFTGESVRLDNYCYYYCYVILLYLLTWVVIICIVTVSGQFYYLGSFSGQFLV